MCYFGLLAPPPIGVVESDRLSRQGRGDLGERADEQGRAKVGDAAACSEPAPVCSRHGPVRGAASLSRRAG
eukprot:5952993-Pleurochrysis_carterae.AAC.1